MDLLNCNFDQPQVEPTLSLRDLRAKLFPKQEKGRAPVISEEKYSTKTLVGNWVENRAISIPIMDDWKTVYDTDYKPHDSKEWKENLTAHWNNKLFLEGLPPELWLYQNRKGFSNNMTSTYDLSYNILPKGLEGPRPRTYNTRQQSWIPEQDLTKNYGNLTQFGLREILKKEFYMYSDEGIATCRWKSTYDEEIGQIKSTDVKPCTQFNLRRVDMNVPDLTYFKNNTSDIQRCILPFSKAK